MLALTAGDSLNTANVKLLRCSQRPHHKDDRRNHHQCDEQNEYLLTIDVHFTHVFVGYADVKVIPSSQV